MNKPLPVLVAVSGRSDSNSVAILVVARDQMTD